jgi:hypothetical protein
MAEDMRRVVTGALGFLKKLSKVCWTAAVFFFL